MRTMDGKRTKPAIDQRSLSSVFITGRNAKCGNHPEALWASLKDWMGWKSKAQQLCPRVYLKEKRTLRFTQAPHTNVCSSFIIKLEIAPHPA